MAGSGHVFDLLQEVRLALGVAAPILLRQVQHLLLIILPHKFPDNFLCDVPADVLIVIALALHLLLLDLAEDAESAIWLLMVLSIVIIELSVRVAEDDIVGDSERGRFKDQGAVSVWDFVEVW